MAENKKLEQKEVNIELPGFEEFTNTPMKMNIRSNPSYSDEMVFRRAKIYKVLGPKDDRLQVQVLPELMGIEDSEMDDLPKYPPFIKGTVITGKSHKDDGDKAEYVWVLCTPDLQMGYILGKANTFGDTAKKYPDSYSWSDVKSFLRERRALPEDFDYKHLTVINWVISDKGGFINCFNYLTGDYVLLNTSGTIFTMQQKRLYMRVGTPKAGGGKTAFSAITMTTDKIHFKSPNIEFDAEDLVLAHNGLNGFGTASAGVLIGKNGISGNSVRNVHL
jgi:hypothetical protein